MRPQTHTRSECAEGAPAGTVPRGEASPLLGDAHDGAHRPRATHSLLRPRSTWSSTPLTPLPPLLLVLPLLPLPPLLLAPAPPHQALEGAPSARLVS